MNKDLLISFLNALFNGSEKEIEDVQYLNGENLGEGYGDRRSIFDVYCTAKQGQPPPSRGELVAWEPDFYNFIQIG